MSRLLHSVGIAFCITMLVACGHKGIFSPYSDRSSSWSKDIHIVKRGDTLYSIAWQYGKDVRTLAEWNHISPPYTIYPKQNIALQRPEKNTYKNKDVSANKSLPSTTKSTPYKPRTRKNARPVAKNNIRSKRIPWLWPTDGKVISKFSASDPGRKGIDIAGRAGQAVYAAADGEVVYSGSGLRGYGELIIIKHNETFFSAYAHNKRLLTSEKKKVKKGERIADMGSTGSDQVKLHFEIRRNGVPVNPYYYLPKR